MPPFWNLFYAPVILAALPSTLLLNTWANWAELVTKSAGRRQTHIRGWVATTSADNNVISIRPDDINCAESLSKVTATHSEESNNIVSFVGKGKTYYVVRPQDGNT